MGVSTNGILCYGFQIIDDEVDAESYAPLWLRRNPADEESEAMDFDEFLAKLKGFKPPEPQSDFDQRRYQTDKEYAASWDAYSKSTSSLEDEFGVTLVAHAYSEEPMYILAAKGSVKTARRGYPEGLGEEVVPFGNWRLKIQQFCTRANIPFREPQFLLCSYWST